MQLAVQKHKPLLAEPLGVEEEEIQILSYCGVKVAYERTKRVSYPTTRILALSEEDLFLFTGDIKTAPQDNIIKIPLSDIGEADLLKSEVVLRTENRLLVIALYKTNVYHLDREKTKDLFARLVGKGVTEFTSTMQSYTKEQRRKPTYFNQQYQPQRISDRWLNSSGNFRGTGNAGGPNSSGNNTYIKY